MAHSTPTLLILGWLACGVISYGLGLPYFALAGPPPTRGARWFIVIFMGCFSLLGPINLFTALWCRFERRVTGWQWWPEVVSEKDDPL